METEKKESNASERERNRSQFGHHHMHEHHHHGAHPRNKSISRHLNLYNLFVALTVLLGIILVVNVILTFNLNGNLKKNAEALKEKLRPAKIELTAVRNSKCPDCFDISTIISSIKNSNANITSEKMLEFDSKEGKEIISKYKIGKIPSIVVTGEIDKVNAQELDKKENALVFAKTLPPYTDAATGETKGRVALFNLKDASCEKCSDMDLLVKQIKLLGIKIVSEKNISTSSDEGKALIKKYNLGFVPSIILSKDADAYDIVQKVWLQVGSKEADGSYVLRVAAPPFINITTGQLRGIVNIVYLTDKSCTECYNVNLHKGILTSPQSFAMKIDKEETIDVSDAQGKELVAKYNITQAPTIILSQETSAYPSSQGLKQFFSIEKDGSYIFRKLSVMGIYKDLTTSQVVKPQQQQSQNAVA